MTIHDITRLIVLLAFAALRFGGGLFVVYRQAGKDAGGVLSAQRESQRSRKGLAKMRGSFRWHKVRQYVRNLPAAGTGAAVLLLSAALTVAEVCLPGQALAMSAPGDGDAGWHYDQSTYHWYYDGENGQPYVGWLKYHDDWYWFDQSGRMASGGERSVGGLSYYFFVNGHMARDQFVGMKYYNDDGLKDGKHDVRIIGSGAPTSEERDLFSDAMFEVPRSWIAQFVKDGWQFMYYTKKKYFAAPDTDAGIYFVYHDTDTRYKKIKLTRAESAAQAFGEYVGYAAGCYRKDDPRMQVLWQEQNILMNLLELPGYYANDAQFYFGKVFAAYLDGGMQRDMQRFSPATCRVMEEVLHLKDDEDVKTWLREKEAEEEKEREQRRAAEAIDERYGPGMETAAEAGKKAGKEDGTAAEAGKKTEGRKNAAAGGSGDS